MRTEKMNNLKSELLKFAGINSDSFSKSESMFELKLYKKGSTFNIKESICKNLGFVTKGLFRIYYADPKSGDEINLWFFKENEFMVSFKSFIAQIPCYYTIEAMEDSEVFQISHPDLLKLFQSSPVWERFGRLLAEQYFYGSQARTESFIFNSPEERYLELIKTSPEIFKRVSLIHIASYLGIKSQSLSRIRRRIANQSIK
jgi:CRP-like cAMP-binding protein